MRPCFQAGQGFLHNCHCYYQELNWFLSCSIFWALFTAHHFQIWFCCGYYCLFVLFRFVFISFYFSATLLPPGKKSILPTCVLLSQSCQSRVLQSLHSDLAGPHLQNFESETLDWWEDLGDGVDENDMLPSSLNATLLWTCFPLYSIYPGSVGRILTREVMWKKTYIFCTWA